VKEQFPEYEGWNASALHEESSYVSEAMIKTQATNSRCHLIYDITGRKSDKVRTAIEELSDYGYGVYLLLMDLPPWQAICRVWQRFQKNPFGRIDPTKPGGRYVDLRYVYKEVGDHPRLTYQLLKNHKAVKGYCRVDAAKPESRQPCIASHGKGW